METFRQSLPDEKSGELQQMPQSLMRAYLQSKVIAQKPVKS